MLAVAEQPSERELLERAVEISRELDRRDQQQRFHHYFPDETHVWRGETFHARELYPRQMEMFDATRTHLEVCMMAANRTGKTKGGGYAVSCWLTGRYPDWWPGRRFDHPIEAWASGKTNETTRDIIQTELFGAVVQGSTRSLSGTGMVPGEDIGSVRWKQGVADLCDTVKIRHVSGGWSTLGFKAYQQGRGAYEGTERHVNWFDEEPPMDIYTEALTRLATTNGINLSTFTPLEGMSEVAMMFLPQDMRPDLSA